MTFYILTLYKIEAHEHGLNDFIADDLLSAIQAGDTKIAIDEDHFLLLAKAYPKYHKYEITIGRKN
jgi:hypothetical protein